MQRTIVTYPGIHAFKRVDFTLSPGVRPSSGIIITGIQDRLPVAVGDLKMSFEGGGTVTLNNCALTFGGVQVDNNITWRFQIVDRRWKWKFSEIHGKYNVRYPDGSIKLDTKKSVKELLEMLFKALDERRPDIEQAPTGQFPQVDWDYERADLALASLCDHLSCLVTLGTDNRAHVFPRGQGRDLPGGAIMSGGQGISAGSIPEKIKLVGGPVVFQDRLQLQAVGYDPLDAKVQPLHELLYAPDKQADNGGFENPWFPAADASGFLKDNPATTTNAIKWTAAQLRWADRTVYRWYRVVGPALQTTPLDYKDEIQVPQNDMDVDTVKVKDIRILGHVIDTTTNEKGEEVFLPARIFGDFNSMGGDIANVTDSFFDGQFSIDAEKRLVKFSLPIFKTETEADVITSNIPADIVLETAFHVVDEFGHEIRYTREKNLPGDGEGTLLFFKDEVERSIAQEYEVGGKKKDKLKDNKDEARREADYYLNAEVKRLQPKESKTLQYAGIMNISPDGAIRQVSWHVGEGPTTTRASSQEDHAFYLESFEEVRRKEKADEAAQNLEKFAGKVRKIAAAVSRFLEG